MEPPHPVHGLQQCLPDEAEIRLPGGLSADEVEGTLRGRGFQGQEPETIGKYVAVAGRYDPPGVRYGEQVGGTPHGAPRIRFQ